MGRIATVLCMLCATFWPGLVFACTLAPPLVNFLSDVLTENRRIDQQPNCSFVNGGRYDVVEGEPALDVGDGRVVQMLSTDKAIVVDCFNSESLVVLGKIEGVYEACGEHTEYSLAPQISPDGPLQFDAGSTLAEFAAHAASVDVEVTLDAVADQADERRKDRFDVFCGCKLFYPDSAGAQN